MGLPSKCSRSRMVRKFHVEIRPVPSGSSSCKATVEGKLKQGHENNCLRFIENWGSLYEMDRK